MNNEALDAVTNELNSAGIEYRVDPRHTHLHLIFSVNGVERKQILPKTPSDWRASKNARSLIRSTLRSMGVNLHQTPEIEAPLPESKPPPIAPPVAYKPQNLLFETTLSKVQILERDMVAKSTKLLKVEADNAQLRIELERLAAMLEKAMSTLSFGDASPDIAETLARVKNPPVVRQLSYQYLRPSVIRRLARLA